MNGQPLHSTLLAVAESQHGLFTEAQALDAGYAEHEIDRRVRAKSWHRIRRDVLVERSRWTSAGAVERHLLTTRAALLPLDVPAVVSHWSAAAAWGLALHRPNLSRVHLTRPDLESARLEAGIHHHAARLKPGEYEILGGLTVTTVPRTVVDVARVGPFDSAVVAADSALRRGLDRGALRSALDGCTDYSGAGAAGRVVAFADERAESAGESLARVAFAELDLPAPELQVEFHESDQTVFARCDFVFLEQCTVAEFDGRLTYYRGLRDGEDPSIVVRREKKREARLREEFGHEVFRVTWSDLHPANRAALGERVLKAFATAERRRAA